MIREFSLQATAVVLTKEGCLVYLDVLAFSTDRSLIKTAYR